MAVGYSSSLTNPNPNIGYRSSLAGPTAAGGGYRGVLDKFIRYGRQSRLTSGTGPSPEETYAIAKADLDERYNAEQGAKELALRENELALREKDINRLASQWQDQYALSQKEFDQRKTMDDRNFGLAETKARNERKAASISGVGQALQAVSSLAGAGKDFGIWGKIPGSQTRTPSSITPAQTQPAYRDAREHRGGTGPTASESPALTTSPSYTPPAAPEFSPPAYSLPAAPDSINQLRADWEAKQQRLDWWESNGLGKNADWLRTDVAEAKQRYESAYNTFKSDYDNWYNTTLANYHTNYGTMMDQYNQDLTGYDDWYTNEMDRYSQEMGTYDPYSYSYDPYASFNAPSYDFGYGAQYGYGDPYDYSYEMPDYGTYDIPDYNYSYGYDDYWGSGDWGSMPSSGGSSYEGGGTVICTELNRQGILPDEVFKYDTQLEIDREAYQGYRIWADHVVRWMQKSRLVTEIVKPFGLAFAYEAAYRMNPEIKGSGLGRLLFKVGLPFCRWVYRQSMKNAQVAEV